jgi:hypothetical protein
MTKSRGIGRGRKQVVDIDKSTHIMEDLMLAAFKAARHGLVSIAREDIRLVYGRQGVREWETWFELVELGHGVGGTHGVTSTWQLRFTLQVAAYKLLSQVQEDELVFPSDAIKELMNKRDYAKWASRFVIEMKSLAAEWGHREVPPPPYTPKRRYAIKGIDVRDGGNPSRTPLTSCTRGYLELVTGGENGFTTTYEGWLPQVEEVPY